MGQAVWPEDRVERLLKLRREGKTASEIGGLLGCSRNAVIGKLARLPEKVAVPSGTQRLGGQRSAASRKLKRISFDFGFRPTPDELKAPRRAPVEPPRPAEMKAARATGDKALGYLRTDDCRWPIGDPRKPDFRFCGCAREPGLAYCAEHYIASTRKNGQPHD